VVSRPLRPPAVIVAVLSAAALVVSLAATPAAAATDLLPDLVQKVPTQVQIGGNSTSGWQIGFQSEVMNQGSGPFEIHGHRSSTTQANMTADQIIYQSPSGTRMVPGVGTLHYEVDPTHQHWHFQPFDHYELRTLDGTLIGTDVKQGFCLGDNAREGATGNPVYGFTAATSGYCKQNQPDALDITEGISVGWGDPYDPLKEGQAIPINQSTEPAGDYNLVHRVNESPDGVPGAVQELSFANNVASDWVRIAWSNGTPAITVLKTCTATASCGPVPPPPPGGTGSPPSGTGSSPPPAGGVLGAGPVGPVAATLRFAHLQSVASLLRHGLNVRVHCSKACRMRVTLKTAGGVVLGTTTAKLSRRGSKFLRLTLRPIATRLLRSNAIPRLSLGLSVRGSDGIRRTVVGSLGLRH
jgi:Lysyl oxidase